MISATYDSFTEGFDTADLKEAKALLDELSNYSQSERRTCAARSAELTIAKGNFARNAPTPLARSCPQCDATNEPGEISAVNAFPSWEDLSPVG